MQKVKPKWRESGAVLVCEKCYKQRIPEETPEIAARIGDFNLRDWLKHKLKEAGYGKRIRAMSTSCQDVCAKGLVTVSIIPEGTSNEIETYALDPINDRDELYQRIIKTLDVAPRKSLI